MLQEGVKVSPSKDEPAGCKALGIRLMGKEVNAPWGKRIASRKPGLCNEL